MPSGGCRGIPFTGTNQRKCPQSRVRNRKDHNCNKRKGVKAVKQFKSGQKLRAADRLF